MLHPDLRQFIETLKREGELHLVEETVDPHLELAEIQRRIVSRQGPALLFTRVARSFFPVVTNLFGTRRRIELAFGPRPGRLLELAVRAAEAGLPPTIRRMWQMRDLIRAGTRLGPRRVRSGPVLERRMAPPRLRALPQVQSWPADGGPFLTLPLVYTRDPASGKGNLGMYRNQIHDDRTAGMHIQIHRGGGFHFFEAEKLGQALPANIFLGGPPALILSAIAPLPENVPELVFASFLMGSRLPVIDDPGVSPLPVVAQAEFVLVGRIPPGIRRTEGPFGDHYGYYSMACNFPVFEVEKIYHRRDAIFPATVVGRPPQEDHYIGEFLQDFFAPLYPLVMNGVVDVRAYDEAGVHPLAAAVVKERYRREAFMAALRILGEGQLSLTKFLLVTDTRVPLNDAARVLVHVLERADPATDLYVFSQVSQDTLDHTSRKMNEGSKAVLLGLGDRKYVLAPAPAAELRNPAFRRQRVFLPGILVVQGPPWKEKDDVPAALLDEPAAAPFRIVCLVDNADACVQDSSSFLWTVFTRFEPAADIHSAHISLDRYHVGFTAPLVLDCRMKPWYPPVVEPDPETVRRVDELWPKMFPGTG
ncbi:MAG: UbiD family decarboxylase, partial [Acidobacteria bacterium]|nr:UbiD family decarboxylase [Acidobacteriota bacterium]